MARYIASNVQHWQWPEGIIRKKHTTLTELVAFLRSNVSPTGKKENCITQIHDIVVAQTLTRVLEKKEVIPTARTKIKFVAGDEIMLVEAYYNNAEGQRRTLKVEDGQILSQEDLDKLKLDYWHYTTQPEPNQSYSSKVTIGED